MAKDDLKTFVGFGMSPQEALDDAHKVALKADPDLKEEEYIATVRRIKGHPARFLTRVKEEKSERNQGELPPPVKGREP
jgi:hypothetical protein